MSDVDYIFKLKQYINQLLINNEIIDCIFVNPKDYDNYIMSFAKKASVNYDAPYFGTIDPVRFYGIPIIIDHYLPEGHFIKHTALTPYIPLQVSQIIFDTDGKAKVKPR